MRGILASVDEHTGTTLSSSDRSLFFPLAFPSPPHPIVTNWPRESGGARAGRHRPDSLRGSLCAHGSRPGAEVTAAQTSD